MLAPQVGPQLGRQVLDRAVSKTAATSVRVRSWLEGIGCAYTRSVSPGPLPAASLPCKDHAWRLSSRTLVAWGTCCGCHRMDRVGPVLAPDVRSWRCRHLCRMGPAVVQEDRFIAATWRLGGRLRRRRGLDYRGSCAPPLGINANGDFRHNRGLLLPLQCLRPLPTVLPAGAIGSDGIPVHSSPNLPSRRCTAARYSNHRAHNRPPPAADAQLTCLADPSDRRARSSH